MTAVSRAEGSLYVNTRSLGASPPPPAEVEVTPQGLLPLLGSSTSPPPKNAASPPLSFRVGATVVWASTLLFATLCPIRHQRSSGQAGGRDLIGRGEGRVGAGTSLEE